MSYYSVGSATNDASPISARHAATCKESRWLRWRIMRRFKAIAGIIVLLALFWTGTPGGDFPYLTDRLLEQFAAFAEGRVAPFQVELSKYRDGRWEFRRGYCTAPLILATAAHIYGLVANHCTVDTATRRILGFYVLGQQATVLEYHRPPNEVRIWRIPNSSRPAGAITEIAHKAWWPGMQVFVVGVQRVKRGADDRRQDDVFDTWYTRGSVVNAMQGHDLWGYGDMVHDGSVTYGFSGGPTFVFNEQTKRFELIALTNGAEIVSALSYVYTVNKDDVLNEISKDAASAQLASTPPLPDQPPSESRGRFSNWQEVPPEVQAQWAAWYAANEAYRIDSLDVIVVSGGRVRIGPLEKVIDARLSGRLPSQGRLQDVNWSEFAWIP